MKERLAVEVMFLHEGDVSISDLQEPFDALPSGAVARCDAQCKRLARVRCARVNRMAISAREAILLRGGERRSSSTATVESGSEMSTTIMQYAGAARSVESGR